MNDDVENILNDLPMISVEQGFLRRTGHALPDEPVSPSYISGLETALRECREFLDAYADVNDGNHGEPVPNRAMQLVSVIDAALKPSALPRDRNT